MVEVISTINTNFVGVLKLLAHLIKYLRDNIFYKPKKKSYLI